MSGATAIQKKPNNLDYSEMNNSTNAGSGTFNNSMAVSPNRNKLNQTNLRSPNLGATSKDLNGSRKYVANVIERDLFGASYANTKQDLSGNTGAKDGNNEAYEPPVYRKRNL